MRLIPNSASIAAVTWSPDAEECYLLDVPVMSTSTDSSSRESLPKMIKSLPLPTDGTPVAMDIGALVDEPEPLPLIVGLLTSGAVFAFKILPPKGDQASLSSSVIAGFRLWCGAADKAPQLPMGNFDSILL